MSTISRRAAIAASFAVGAGALLPAPTVAAAPAPEPSRAEAFALLDQLEAMLPRLDAERLDPAAASAHWTREVWSDV
jgi:hypothetical protein